MRTLAAKNLFFELCSIMLSKQSKANKTFLSLSFSAPPYRGVFSIKKQLIRSV